MAARLRRRGCRALRTGWRQPHPGGSIGAGPGYRDGSETGVRGIPGLTAARRHLGPVALLVTIALGGLGFIITRPDGLMNVHSDLVAEHLGTQTIFHQLWQKE